MSLLSKRTSAPLAVLALAALPLALPAGANASMGGALTLNSTLTPDLISATVTSASATGTTVRYCFNKTIGTTPVPARFSIGQYDQTAPATGTSASASGQCADVLFNAVSDPTQYTYAGIADNAVVNAATGTFSNRDSGALVGSSTNNGTRGRSTAPDLTGTARSGSTVSYVFDEALANVPTAAQSAQFTLQDVNNATTATGTGAALSADRRTVTITFPVTPTVIANAVRATYSGAGAVTSLATGDATPASAAPMPGSTGATTAPDPVSGELVTDGTDGLIDIVFDQNVVPAGDNPAALLSNGRRSTLVPGPSRRATRCGTPRRS